MKIRKIISLLSLGTIGVVPLCNLPTNNTQKTILNLNNNASADKYCGGLKAPDLENNDFRLLKKYFAPNYSSSAKEFFPTTITKGIGSYFPKLWKTLDDGKLQSITFKQLFINESIANSVIKSLQIGSINEPVLVISDDGKSITENHLSKITTLNFASLLVSSSDLNNSPEQLLAALFINPWLYDLSLSSDSANAELKPSYALVNNIELQNNSLTSIPTSTFDNIGSGLEASSTLTISLDSNNLSYVGADQFGSNTAINLTLLFSNNKLDVNTTVDAVNNNFNNKFKAFNFVNDTTIKYNYFSPIDPTSNYFLYDLIYSEFDSRYLWPSELINDQDIFNKIASEIDDLNLYPVQLKDSTDLNKIVTISSNDWTGRFNITIHSGDIDGANTYTENITLHQKIIPLMLAILMLVCGSVFIYDRVKKLVKGRKK